MMRLDETASTKFKYVCADFPNLALIIKSSTLGEIQVTFGHTSIGNKYLEETGTAFALSISLEFPTVVSIDANCDFSSNGEKIRLLVTEVLLCTAVGNLTHSKNLRNWA